MSGWATAISAFFNDRLFSLSEDLILAEERTTERDRKKITEGETRAIEMVSFEIASLQALILWSKSSYPPPLRCLIMPRASTASWAVAPFIIYARFGWQRPAQRARESGELGRKEGALCLLPALPLARLICKWDSAREGRGRTHYYHFPHCAEALLPALLTFLCMLALMATT